jgi:hypothetical protein
MIEADKDVTTQPLNSTRRDAPISCHIAFLKRRKARLTLACVKLRPHTWA